MSNEPQTPTVTVTDEFQDVTEKDRSPVENAFYESFLLQSRSAIENLYASNIYHSQKHAKHVKDLERQAQYSMSQMGTKQKEMVKKMAQLQEKQEKIMEEKRKQHLLVLSKRGDQRVRPHSTSALANGVRPRPLLKDRPRSGSMPFLDPVDPNLLSKHLSKSTENLSLGSGNLLCADFPASALSRSCEDLTCHGKKNKVLLPSLSVEKSSPSSPLEDFSDNPDTTFITRMPPSPPTKPRVNLNLSLTNFKPEHRRGSLDPSIIRELDKRHGVSTDSPQTSPRSTKTKWIPKSFGLSHGGRTLPPI